MEINSSTRDKRLRKLADVIEFGIEDILPGGDFDMSRYTHEKWSSRSRTKVDVRIGDSICSSPACMAGWAVFIFRPERYRKILEGPYVGDSLHEEARNTLGLYCIEANLLFTPGCMRYGELDEEGELPEYGEINNTWAARVLRNLADTGVVNWDI